MLLNICIFESTTDTDSTNEAGNTESQPEEEKDSAAGTEPKPNNGAKSRNVEINPETSYGRVMTKCIEATATTGTECKGQTFSMESSFDWGDKKREDFVFSTYEDLPNGNKAVVFNKYIWGVDRKKKKRVKRKDSTDTFKAEYKKINGEWVLQEYRRNYDFPIGSKRNKIELEYPKNYDENVRYSKIKINGNPLNDGGIMKVQPDGYLTAMSQFDSVKVPKNSTVFMNGANVEQRQLLDYAKNLNTDNNSNMPIYMVANISKGLIDDGIDIASGQRGLYDKESTRLAEKRRLVAEITSHQDSIRNLKEQIETNKTEGKHKANKSLEITIKSLEKEIEKKEARKSQLDQLYDKTPDASKKNPVRNFNDPSIHTMESLLRGDRAKNIFSHSQGSMNVAVALGIVGNDEFAKRKLEGVSWTSVGGAYSERNIYELPEGLDVQLNYHKNDGVSKGTSGVTKLSKQERNKLAIKKYDEKRVIIKDKKLTCYDSDDRFNCKAHDYTEYNWATKDFFKRI